MTGEEEKRQSAHIAPFIERAAMEAAATPRRDDALMFLREFVRELAGEIGLGTKLLVLLIVTALAGGVIFLGVSAYRELGRVRLLDEEQNRRLNEQSRQAEQTGERVAQTSGQIAQTGELVAQAGELVARIRERLAGAEESNREVAKSLSLAPTLWGRYHRGVCLIVGSYFFVERDTGRPLRYHEQLLNAYGEPVPGAVRLLQLTPEGTGPVFEVEYIGTGFYVGGGYVVTNRHIASAPFEADPRAQEFGAFAGGEPRVRGLLAYFPGRREPLPLKLKLASKEEDLAVCALVGKGEWDELPALPLEEGGGDVTAVGKAVLMMGYAGGPERMLAQLPDRRVRELLARHGDSLKGLTGELAGLGFIRPLTTQGHVTDLSADRIMYDAATAEGGSGAPVFGPSGKVVGVSFAALREGDYSNFAVPVRGADSLLRRAGWRRE